MSLFDELQELMVGHKRAETQETKEKAKELVKTLEPELKELAKQGKTEHTVQLDDNLLTKAVQEELKNTGLRTQNLKDNKILISWEDKEETGLLYRWYELENSIDERNVKINFMSESLEEVKENMSRFSDWYRENGTGAIFENVVLKKGVKAEIKRREVFRK